MYKEIDNDEALKKLFSGSTTIEKHAFHSLKIESGIVPTSLMISDSIFLGCEVPPNFEIEHTTRSHFFPAINKPFHSYPNSLYTKETLMGAYRFGVPDSYESTYDKLVYDHFIAQGKEADDIGETLARRVHDHSITDALFDFLSNFDDKKIVAVMGGHNLLRDNKNFATVARISKALTESGYLMVSGGGPGAMEATHVGAWLAGRDEKSVDDVVSILSEAPGYKDRLWLDKAFKALQRYPVSEYESIGIPTWLYGHEPPTPFASKIAKYFANSVREDGLLAIAKGGVIFAPGNAGTIQEVFQDATQNHYLNYGYASPMVFLNIEYWTVQRPIYPLLKEMSKQGKYKNLILSGCDTKEQVLAEIEAFT